MKTLHAAILALALPVSLAAQQPPPNTAGGPITTAFRGRMGGFYRNLAQAFDSIPESKFSYKPTPAQLTIGYVAQHLANDNYFFCSNFGEMKPTRSAEETSTPDSVKATWPKAKLVAQLKESITFCQAAFAQLDDTKLGEAIQISFGSGPSRPSTRAAMALGHSIDMADHYSQIANYMRLNNMLPPSALPRPRPGGN
jgi:hypothetical protein